MNSPSRDDAMRGDRAVDGIERRRDNIHAQHHPGPAPVRLVVDAPVTVGRPQPQIVDVHVQDPLGDRAPAFLARVPAFENRVRLGHDVRPAGWATS